MRVRLLREIGELEEIAASWDDLWRRTNAAPFQSPAWLIAWQKAFAPGPPCCAAVWIDGALAALLPFYLETGARGRRLMPLGVSISDYLDILRDPRCPQAAVAAVARLGEEAWDEWRFENLAPDAQAWSLPTPPGLVECVEAQEACPVLDLDMPIPARQRRKLRRAHAIAERLGGLVVRREAEPESFLDDFYALHAGRWESRGEPGVLADARVRAFHRAALPRLQALGAARLWSVSIAGRPAGAYYGFANGRRAYAYLGGFDPAFADASPGALAIEAAVAEAAREGATEFHFLRGREDYKYAWGARDRVNRARLWRRA